MLIAIIGKIDKSWFIDYAVRDAIAIQRNQM